MQRRHMGVTTFWLVLWSMILIFPYIGNNNPNWRTHSIIFQRGRRKTTNQMHLFGRHCGSSGSSQLAKMPPCDLQSPVDIILYPHSKNVYNVRPPARIAFSWWVHITPISLWFIHYGKHATQRTSYWGESKPTFTSRLGASHCRHFFTGKMVIASTNIVI